MQYKIRKYPVKNPALKMLVNFFWVIKDSDVIVNHKLLPIKNVDLVVNLNKEPSWFSSDNDLIKRPDLYFVGITGNYKFRLIEKGNTEAIGISFKPNGFHPFVGIPMEEFKNKVIDFSSINPHFTNEVLNRITNTENIHSKLEILEEILYNLIKPKFLLPENQIKMLHYFYNNMEQQGIKQLCSPIGISSRQLERVFNKHLGIAPKTFMRINRFQNTVNRLLFTKYENLTDITYQSGYYDQMHFIKEFKKFSGSTPSNFLKQKESLKEISYFV